MAESSLSWTDLAGFLSSESAGSLFNFCSLSLSLNFVYLLSREPHSQQICLLPGRLLQDTVVVRDSSQCETSTLGCSCCCCCLGCCYTQIARGNWQPLKESKLLVGRAGRAGWDWSQVNVKLRVCGWICCNLQRATCNSVWGKCSYSHCGALRKIVGLI